MTLRRFQSREKQNSMHSSMNCKAFLTWKYWIEFGVNSIFSSSCMTYMPTGFVQNIFITSPIFSDKIEEVILILKIRILLR